MKMKQDRTLDRAENEANGDYEGFKDSEDRDDDYYVDHGKFVIHNTQGVQHVEKLGRLQENNRHR